MKFKGSIPWACCTFCNVSTKTCNWSCCISVGNNEHGYQNGILEFACQLGKLTSNVVGEPASQSEPAVPLLARILSRKIQTKSKPQIQCILSRKIQTKSKPQIQCILSRKIQTKSQLQIKRIDSGKIQTKSQQQIQLSVWKLLQLKILFSKGY